MSIHRRLTALLERLRISRSPFGPDRQLAFLPWGLLSARIPRRAQIRRLVRLLRPIDAGVPLIRVGPAGDGGYLVADDLVGVIAAFSPGVGSSTGFEDDLARRGVPSFLMDATVGPPAGHEARFRAELLGTTSSAGHRSLDDWVSMEVGDGSEDLLLQMDIEGAEWAILASTPGAVLARFRLIVVELHGFGRRAGRADLVLRLRALENLRATHDVVNVHPNNCCGVDMVRGRSLPKVLEVSLLRRDRVHRRAPVDGPDPLERDNIPDLRPIALGPEWYGRPRRSRRTRHPSATGVPTTRSRPVVAPDPVEAVAEGRERRPE